MARDPKPTGDYYAVLGLEPGATVAEARVAYHRRARLLHPDHHPDATDEERARLDQAMAALNVAWEAIERGDVVAAVRPTRSAEWVEVPGFEEDWRWWYGAGLRLTGPPHALAGLRDLPGVVSVDLHDRPVSDHDLARAGDMADLRRLIVAGTRITDRGVAVVAARFPTIRDLDLSSTAVTDAGLEALAVLAGLHSLTLVETAVTDAGLAALGSVTSLEILNLRSTRVRGEGLHHLAGLPRLRLLPLPRVHRVHRTRFAAARPDVELL